MQLLGLEPGTWADWANAAATTLAFTVALVLFVIGLRDRRRANEERRIADEHRLRDQARRVWIEVESQQGATISTGEMVVDRVLWVIRNTSDEAIFKCRVMLLDASRWRVVEREPDIDLVLPNSLKRNYTSVVNTIVNDNDPPPPVPLVFTDAAGVQWWRDSKGSLELLERPLR